MRIYFHLFPALNLLAGLLLFSLGVFALYRKRVSGTGLFAILVFTAGFIAVSYFFELAAREHKWKVFFMNLQFFGTAPISVFWLLLAAHFSGFNKLHRPKYLLLLLIIPLATLVLIWTNEYHHLMWRAIQVRRAGKIFYLDVQEGYWFFIQQFYMYGIYIVGAVIFIRHALRSPQPYRNQSIAFLIASFIPWLLSSLFSFHLFPRFGVNFSPISFAFSGLAIWWAIFRYNLLDIMPAAKEKLLENMKAGIVVTDFQGRVVEINPFIEQLFQCKGGDVIGKDVKDLWPELTRDMPSEWKYRTAGGESIYMEIDKTPITGGGGIATGYLYLIVNSTEKRNTAIALKHTEEYLFQTQKYEALGRLAGGIAHDFNNILTIIYNYGKIDLSGKVLDINQIEENLKEIQKAVERGQALTQQLLAFSKAQIVMEDIVSIAGIMSEMRDMLGHFVKPEVNLVLIENEDSGMIRANKHQIERVILNLVQNGDEAMSGKGELIITWGKTFLFEHDLHSVYDVQAGVYSYFSVSDTGKGIKKENLERIFDPFFTTKGMGKGIGLGLSTVYGIVKQLKGHIDVESRKNKGTVFRIYIPALDS